MEAECNAEANDLRILLIEDDRALCRALTAALAREGYTSDECHDGEDGLSLLCEGQYAAAILDRMLPGMDGLAVMRAARKRGVTTPVLMLTALDRVGDRVDGLDAGADDYLTKPFDTRELLARLRALLRRRDTSPAPGRQFFYADLVLDAEELTLTGPKGAVTLSRTECDLAEALLNQAGRLAGRAMLMGWVWGAQAVEESNLDTYIHFLRRRLRAVGSRVVIATVRGAGYRLETAEDSV